MFFFNLIGGTKGVIIIALFLAVGGWAGFKTLQVSRAETKAKEAIEERDLAAMARDKAVAVNDANLKTIQQMNQEKELIQTSLNNLEEQRKKDSVNIGKLSDIISRGKSNPANQVGLSPVVQDVILQIQNDRAARAGVQK